MIAGPAGRRQEGLFLAATILLALAVRLLITQISHVLQGDEGAYLWLGKTLVTGGGYQFFGRPELHYTPLYPLVSGVIWLLVRDLVVATKICFVVFGGLTVWPIYLIARRLYGPTTALIAGALVAVEPAITSYVYFYGSMTEPLYFFLSFWGIYLALVALDEDRWWQYAAVGALFSLSYLTRPEGWLFPVITAGYVVLARGIQRRRWTWRALGQAGLVLGAFLVVALPYLLFLRSHLGYWSLTGKTWMAYAQQRALMEGDMVEFDRLSWGLDSTGLEVMYHSPEKFTHHGLLDEIEANPREFVLDVLRNMRQMDSIFLSKRVLPFFLFPIMGLGLFGARWSGRRARGELYLFLLATAPAVTFLIFTTHLRFYLGTVIILLLWIRQGFVEFGKWLGETIRGMSIPSAGLDRNVLRWGTGAAAALGLGLVGYYLLIQPAVTDGLAYQRFDYKSMGEWLRENSPADTTVMSRGAIVAIHANRNWAPFPHAEYDEVIRYARANSVDLIVVNGDEFEVMRPQLAFLADPARVPPELDLVSVYESDGHTTVMYKLVE
jgi:4-amino-4-deoxy-L-arabinose transferase-like glycosyltransferase